MTNIQWFFILTQFQVEIDLKVNENVMKLMLDSVFDSPRSSFSHPEHTFAVGTYLFRSKFRNSIELLIDIHGFKNKSNCLPKFSMNSYQDLLYTLCTVI